MELWGGMLTFKKNDVENNKNNGEGYLPEEGQGWGVKAKLSVR